MAGFLLGLREGMEAALLVGVTFSVLKKTKRMDFAPTVWAGVALASVISVAAALALRIAGAGLAGRTEQVFEGLTMLIAASILTWMIFWMRGQARRVQTGLEEDVRVAALRGQSRALFAIAFFAVLREGIETALFLTAAAFSSGSGATMIGGLLGLTVAAVLGWALYAATVRLNVRTFFQITGLLLLLVAAGLLGHAVHEMNEAGVIPAVVEHVWDVSGFLSEESVLGLFLRSIFGYSSAPSLTEVVAYVAYLAAVAFAYRSGRTPTPQPTVATL